MCIANLRSSNLTDIASLASGQTRPNTDLTEGLSYARLAKLGNIYEQFMDDEQRRKNAGDFDRVTTEVRVFRTVDNARY